MSAGGPIQVPFGQPHPVRRTSHMPRVRGALIERHTGGVERVPEVALPIERAFGIADQTGRHGGAAHVDRTPVAQTL
jgi:hypothetical protein